MTSLLRKTAPRAKGLGVAPPFSVAGNLRRAREMLATPPVESWIRRPEPRGVVVAEFVLPLEYCQTTNATRHAPGWKLGKVKSALFGLMWSQNGGRWKQPLTGFPQVLCVRFTNRIVDSCSDWAKAAVDMLCASKLPGQKRLNIILDDSPRHIELHQWSEPVPRSEGFCYLQVRSEEA
jgi:hypothetical protein